MYVRELVAHFEAGAQRYRAGGNDVRLDTGEKLLERVEAGGEQHVQMPPLRYARARAREVRQFVPIEDGNGPEKISQGGRSGKSGDAGTDHDGSLPESTVRHDPSDGGLRDVAVRAANVHG